MGSAGVGAHALTPAFPDLVEVWRARRCSQQPRMATATWAQCVARLNPAATSAVVLNFAKISGLMHLVERCSVVLEKPEEDFVEFNRAFGPRIVA
jgi:hypothetical protein